MSDVNDLLGQISDDNLRKQLNDHFESLSGSALRNQVGELQEQVKTLKGEKRQRTYRDAGIPESAFDVLDKVYEGDLTPEAVRTFAQEKGFALGGTTSGEQPDPAEQREAGEQRLSQLQSGSIPSRESSLQDQIAEADAKGDTARADRLRVQMLHQ